MKPITSSIAVDSYVPPSVNATYRRAHGEAPLARAQAAPPLPALLRPQLITLAEDDLCGVERRMRFQNRAAEREQRIAERAARVAAEAHAAADVREARLRKQAARHAKAAGEVRVKQVQEEYRTMGMR